MCNEFRFKQSLDRLTDAFSQLRLPLHWAGGAPNLEPRDSIRPTDPAAIVLGSGEGAELRWPFYLGVALLLGAVLGHAALHKEIPLSGAPPVEVGH